jgi:Na+/H+ antiporter NhaC
MKSEASGSSSELMMKYEAAGVSSKLIQKQKHGVTFHINIIFIVIFVILSGYMMMGINLNSGTP